MTYLKDIENNTVEINQKLWDLNIQITEGAEDSGYENETIAMLPGWDAIGPATDIINNILFPELWKEWREYYILAAKLFGKNHDGTPWRFNDKGWPIELRDLRLIDVNLDEYYDDSWRLESNEKLALWYEFKERYEGMPVQFVRKPSYFWAFRPDEQLLELDDYIDCVFGDEYTSCGECNKAIYLHDYRYQSYLIGDGEIICIKCLRDSYGEGVDELNLTNINSFDQLEKELEELKKENDNGNS